MVKKHLQKTERTKQQSVFELTQEEKGSTWLKTEGSASDDFDTVIGQALAKLGQSRSDRAWPGMARLGKLVQSWPGLAKTSHAWPGLAKLGQAWPSLARPGHA